MKKIPFAIILTFLLALQAHAVEVMVSNPSTLSRENETIEVLWSSINTKLALKADEKVIVLNASGKEIPSQILFEGKKVPQKLIFQASLSSRKSAKFTIQKGIPQNYEIKTFGRFVPERAEDYAWENDRVAFRTYGQAAMKTDGPSNGLDIWSKRTDKMIVNKRYKLELVDKKSYHTDWGDGMDFYKVGRTLGAGAMAPFTNDSLWLGSNFTSYETLDNGPIRTSFKLTYAPFNVNGNKVSETRTFSLDAGSQMNKIVEQYDNVTAPMSVTAGMVMRSVKDTVVCNAKNGYAIYFEPKRAEEGNLYLAVVSPKAFKSVKVAKGHLLSVAEYTPKSKLVYYAGNGWSKWGFPTDNLWTKYVKDFAAKLRVPLIVTVK